MPSNRYYFDECSGNGSLGVLLSFGCVSMYIKPNVVLCGFCVVVLALQMAFFVAAAFAFAFLSFFMYFFHVFVFCVLFFSSAFSGWCHVLFLCALPVRGVIVNKTKYCW